MIQELQKLLDNYLVWLRDRTSLRQIEDQWVEITTPYLDRHNDYIQLYVKKQNNGFLLTDDGYTIADLERSGCKLNSPNRQRLLQMTLNGFGIHLQNGALEIFTTSENFPLRKHNLVQAILAINDMFFLAAPVVTSLFYDDVMTWLDSYEIRYTPRVKFTGKSGFDYLFDFVIPKSRYQPERILQTINNPKRDSAQSLILSWFDTKEVRPQNSKAFALLNDSEQTISGAVLDALQNYEVRPVLWSRREEIQTELLA
ncbi:MAG: DUF1829 domain-containing protein [Rectinema sp.]